MQTTTISMGERRRLEKLASELPASRWIVAPVDPTAEVVSIAGSASRSPMYAGVGPNPTFAIARLQAAGVRTRAHLSTGGPTTRPAGWAQPIGLLCLPATDPNLRAVMATWGGDVVAGGHVLFYGGTAPRPGALGLHPGYWIQHMREDGGGLFLLTRRPHG